MGNGGAVIFSKFGAEFVDFGSPCRLGPGPLAALGGDCCAERPGGASDPKIGIGRVGRVADGGMEDPSGGGGGNGAIAGFTGYCSVSFVFTTNGGGVEIGGAEAAAAGGAAAGGTAAGGAEIGGAEIGAMFVWLFICAAAV